MNVESRAVTMSAALALAVGVAVFPAVSAMASPASPPSASVLAGNDYCYGWGPEGPHADQHYGMRYCDNAPLDPSQVDDRR